MIGHDDDQIGCCSRSKFFVIKYMVLVFISAIILTFCIFQIVKSPDSNNTVYFSLISMIIGIFSPSPTAPKLN